MFLAHKVVDVLAIGDVLYRGIVMLLVQNDYRNFEPTSLTEHKTIDLMLTSIY